MEEINYCLIFLHFSPCPINRYKKTILIWTKGFPIFSPSCHFHSTRLCCPCGFIVTPQLTETRWLLPGYGACFLCNNPLPFSTPFLDLWHYLFSINSHCFFLIMAISSFVSPQHLPSIADRVGQDWGIVVVSKCNYWHAPSTHTTMCAQICCWLHICKGKRKSSGRMEIIFKNHIVWQIFSTRKTGFFCDPANPPPTIAQRIICLTSQTSDLWHFHMKWSYLWFRITPVRYLHLENKEKSHLEFLVNSALTHGIHEFVEPKRVIFGLVKFLRDCVRGFIFYFI